MQVDDIDVVVLGAGASGIAAAIAAAESGARVALIERSAWPGGELISGIPILGCANGNGEWVVRGVLTRLLDSVRALGGYVGLNFDWRTMWGACFDPEPMKLAVVQCLRLAGVDLRLRTLATGVATDRQGAPTGLVVTDGHTEQLLRSKILIDASGDGWLAEHAGLPLEEADGSGGFQPISVMFRIAGIDFPRLLEFVRQNPDDLIVAENPFITATREEAAAKVADSGVPFVAIGSEHPGSRLHRAIAENRMFPTTAFYMTPTSLTRSELTLNVTRIAKVNGADASAVSRALPTLADQVVQARDFLVSEVPGFEDSCIAAVGPHVGIRETKRIVGMVELTTQDVLSARKRDDGVARGSHHVDIHADGSLQVREYIASGGSYDIPMGSLIPRGGGNVIVAGRCIGASREASGSARVIGSCVATGEAAGVMAGVAIATSLTDVSDLDVDVVRSELQRRKALLDRTVQ